eukprot:2117337-Alexandrium_andersonii.AAC.1
MRAIAPIAKDSDCNTHCVRWQPARRTALSALTRKGGDPGTRGLKAYQCVPHSTEMDPGQA